MDFFVLNNIMSGIWRIDLVSRLSNKLSMVNCCLLIFWRIVVDMLNKENKIVIGVKSCSNVVLLLFGEKNIVNSGFVSIVILK